MLRSHLFIDSKLDTRNRPIVIMINMCSHGSKKLFSHQKLGVDFKLRNYCMQKNVEKKTNKQITRKKKKSEIRKITQFAFEIE